MIRSRQRKIRNFWTVLLVAIALGVEFYAFSVWMKVPAGNRNAAALQFLGLHLLSLAIGSAGVAVFSRSRHRINSALFGLALWFFLPPLGAVLALFSIYKLRGHDAARPKAVLELLDSMEAEDSYFRDLTIEIRTNEPANTLREANATARPWVDVLRHGTLAERKAAVAEMRRRADIQAVQLLSLARLDTEYDIQHLASLALAAVEREWTKRIQALLNEIEASPGQTSLRNEIVQTYLIVYRSGLLSAELSNLYLRRALEHCVVSIQLNAQQDDLFAQIGKIRLFAGNYPRAVEAFNQAIALNPAKPSYRLWRAEAYYMARDFKRLRQECLELSQLGLEAPEKVRASAAFWAAQGGA